MILCLGWFFVIFILGHFGPQGAVLNLNSYYWIHKERIIISVLAETTICSQKSGENKITALGLRQIFRYLSLVQDFT